MKQQPAFWGRYFNGYHTTDAEYRQDEAERFANMQMKLLPIAQQTLKVAGTRDEGAAHATMNVDKFIERVGLDWLESGASEYVMFLDVEGERVGGNPSLSSEYYVGWSKFTGRNQSHPKRWPIRHSPGGLWPREG